MASVPPLSQLPLSAVTVVPVLVPPVPVLVPLEPVAVEPDEDAAVEPLPPPHPASIITGAAAAKDASVFSVFRRSVSMPDEGLLKSLDCVMVKSCLYINALEYTVFDRNFALLSEFLPNLYPD